MPRARPRAVQKYSDEFKLTAVRLSQQPGVQVKTVAVALEIHPFMLSKWRKDARMRSVPAPACIDLMGRRLDSADHQVTVNHRAARADQQRCRRAFIVILAAFAGVTQAGAQSQLSAPRSPQSATDTTEPINPDRPGIADGSRVIERSQLQVEFGLQEEHREDAVTHTSTFFFPTLFRFGVTDRFEARLESNSVTSTRTTSKGSLTIRTTGYSPVSVGFKYQIYDSRGDARRSLGMIVRAFPPSGSSDFRNDHYTGDARLAADWDFAPKLSLNPNVGAARQEDSRGRTFLVALGALTLTYLPSKRFNLFGDAGFQSPEERGGKSAITLDGGVAYLLGRDVQVDLSAGRGVRGRIPPRPFVAVGLSLRSQAYGRHTAHDN